MCTESKALLEHICNAQYNCQSYVYIFQWYHKPWWIGEFDVYAHFRKWRAQSESILFIQVGTTIYKGSASLWYVAETLVSAADSDKGFSLHPVLMQTAAQFPLSAGWPSHPCRALASVPPPRDVCCLSSNNSLFLLANHSDLILADLTWKVPIYSTFGAGHGIHPHNPSTMEVKALNVILVV